jgi:UDP-N-acetyl-D-galactosamine dehydrogenase
MGEHIPDRLTKLMAKPRINLVDARVLVLGQAYKENCPDIRNTNVVDLIQVLRSYHVDVDVYDPWVDPHEACAEYGIQIVDKPAEHAYDAVVMAVAHDEFRDAQQCDIKAYTKAESVVFDVKHVLPRESVSGRL